MRRIAACLMIVSVLGLSLPAWTQSIRKSSTAYTVSPEFTSGNIVVCRIGTGTAALNNSATAVFLDEYTTAGAFVSSTALPTTNAAVQKALTLSGTATTECQLSRSADGRYLILAGYSQNVGVATVSSSSGSRTFARVDAAGNVDTSTTTETFVTSAIRAAASTDGSGFWSVGSAIGVVYMPFGTAGTGTVVSNTFTNLRAVNIFGGQLYTSSGASTYRLGTVGTGTPTSASNTSTSLPGFPTTALSNAFYFADLDAGVAGVDTLYVADDGSTTGATGGGVKKFSLVSGTWTYNGTFPANGATIPANQFFGLAGETNGTQVTLYATRIAAGNQLVRFVDTTGYNVAPTAVPTLLATAATNTIFRGVALAPLVSPAVTTSGSTNLTATSATLNGSANPNGAATTGYFRYSSTDPGTCNDSFGTRAPSSGGTDLGSGTASVGFSENISGLTPATTYYFCAIAQNSLGTSFGTVQSFSTTAGLPNLSIDDVSLAEGNAGTTAYTFTVTLSAAAPVGGVTFDIATADGTAQDDNPDSEDADYMASSLTGQTIAAGNTSYQFTVQVNGDAVFESDETFFVNVTNVTGATVTDGQGQGTVTNDDLAPSAGPVSIAGRILSRQGRGISGAMVSLTDHHGATFYAWTNSFGYYRFTDVPGGESYILTVRAKQYRFTPQLLTADADVSGLNIYPEQ